MSRRYDVGSYWALPHGFEHHSQTPALLPTVPDSRKQICKEVWLLRKAFAKPRALVCHSIYNLHIAVVRRLSSEFS